MAEGSLPQRHLAMSKPIVPTPFPINCVNGRYLIYDIDTVSYIRREYHICGVLVGTIPHLSNQNVFLGLPLELMPEEARLLVEQGTAYIVDDVDLHKNLMLGMSAAEAEAFKAVVEKQGMKLAMNNESDANEKRKQHLERRDRKSKGKGKETDSKASAIEAGSQDDSAEFDGEESIFGSTETSTSSKPAAASSALKSYAITPATSYPPLMAPAPDATPKLPSVPSSYPLFAHLHGKGYFINPGLRFGCQYCVYPGDPLRFHSHFLAVGKEWNEEFSLIDIVGGGRLGTSVKKAYLIGGADPEKTDKIGGDSSAEPGLNDSKEENVRTFSIEWAGM